MVVAGGGNGGSTQGPTGGNKGPGQVGGPGNGGNSKPGAGAGNGGTGGGAGGVSGGGKPAMPGGGNLKPGGPAGEHRPWVHLRSKPLRQWDADTHVGCKGFLIESKQPAMLLVIQYVW